MRAIAGFLAAVLLSTGCSTYARVEPAALNPNMPAKITFATPATLEVMQLGDSRLVDSVREVKAQYVASRGDTIVASAALLTRRDVPGDRPTLVREARFVPRPGDVVQQRQFSAKHTAFAVLLPIVVFAAYFVASWELGAATAGR